MRIAQSMRQARELPSQSRLNCRLSFALGLQKWLTQLGEVIDHSHGPVSGAQALQTVQQQLTVGQHECVLPL